MNVLIIFFQRPILLRVYIEGFPLLLHPECIQEKLKTKFWIKRVSKELRSQEEIVERPFLDSIWFMGSWDLLKNIFLFWYSVVLFFPWGLIIKRLFFGSFSEKWMILNSLKNVKVLLIMKKLNTRHKIIIIILLFKTLFWYGIIIDDLIRTNYFRKSEVTSSDCLVNMTRHKKTWPASRSKLILKKYLWKYKLTGFI